MAVYVVWWYENNCHGRNNRGHCVYGIGDLANLVTRPEFMANRIDVNFEPLTVECLEAWHRLKEECPPYFDSKFYQSLEFVKKAKTKS